MSWLLVAAPMPAMPPAFAADTPAKQAKPVFERWYAVQLKDQPIGHAHVITRRKDDHLISEETMVASMKRGEQVVHIEQATRFEETLDGKPIVASVEMKLGQMSVQKTMRFTDKGIELTTEQFGRSQTQTLPSPEKTWLPPAAASRYIEKQLAAGAKHIEVRRLSPSIGPEPFTLTMNVARPRRGGGDGQSGARDRMECHQQRHAQRQGP